MRVRQFVSVIAILVSSLVVSVARPRTSRPNQLRQGALSRRFVRLLRKNPQPLYWVALSESLVCLSKITECSTNEIVLTLNGLVFACQSLLTGASHGSAKQALSWEKWMERHLLHSTRSRIRQRYPHTYFTSAFAHSSVEHLSSNMAALALFGNQTDQALGTRPYAYFIAGSAILSHLWNEALFDRIPMQPLEDFRQLLLEELSTPSSSYSGQERWRSPPSLSSSSSSRGQRQVIQPRGSWGASGVVSAVQMYYCMSFPNNPIPLSDDVEVNALSAALIYILTEFFLLGANTGIGHGIHLGGYATGIVWKLMELGIQRFQRIWHRGQRQQRARTY